MSSSPVSVPTAAASGRRLDVRVPLAFAAIYLLWGATYLAVRVAVLEVPPFFAGGVRFLIAGVALYVVMRLRGEPAPSVSEWRASALIALFMFVATYAAMFWAEQYVSSGVTSVIEATMPMITVALEVFAFRQQSFSGRLAIAMLLGFVGVAALLLANDRQTCPPLPCLVILSGGAAWSLGAVLSRALPRPPSVPLAAGAQMMLGGIALLALSGMSGELASVPHVSPRAAFAILYLIVGGSLLGFTAYIWLLARMPATRVASHAYVNPLVAVALGYFVGGETVTPRMLAASLLVISSVFLILSTPADSRPGRAIA